jgi:hypothetical protein
VGLLCELQLWAHWSQNGEKRGFKHAAIPLPSPAIKSMCCVPRGLLYIMLEIGLHCTGTKPTAWPLKRYDEASIEKLCLVEVMLCILRKSATII